MLAALAALVLAALVELALAASVELALAQKDTNAGHNCFHSDLDSAHNTHPHGNQRLHHIQGLQNNRCQIQKVASVLALVSALVSASGHLRTLLALNP